MARRSASRLVLLGGVLGFAALALANGLDRASARNPALAGYVPALFKAEAWRAGSAKALEAGKTAEAIVAARSAVAADPIDPRSTALLGAGHLARREQVRADLAFRVAARFGWRDPLTQLYFMNAALNAGEPRLAALRLDAVLRQAPDFPVRDMLLAQFEGTTDRRAALAERLALRPPWTFAFLNHASQVPLPELRARAEIVGGMKPKWGCDTVAPLVDKLLVERAVSDAKALWLAQCEGAAPGVADPHFAVRPLGRAPVAFEWNLVGNGDVSAMPSVPPGQGLLVRVGGATMQPFAWQLLSLAPGRYRVSWTAVTAAGEAAPGSGASLGCAPNDRQLLAAAAVGKGRFEATVNVDAACPGRFLTLWLAPGSDEARFDDVTVAPF